MMQLVDHISWRYYCLDQGEGHQQGDGEVGAGAELPPGHPQLSAGGALQVGQKELRSRDIFS